MPRTYAALMALAAATACGPRAVPTPAPAPPPPAARAGRAADSARAEGARADRARADSARADSMRAVARAARAEVPALPRASARTDTLPMRALRGTVRVCAGGDVTLGTNLDTAWARVASARLRTRFRQRDDPMSLLAPLQIGRAHV